MAENYVVRCVGAGILGVALLAGVAAQVPASEGTRASVTAEAVTVRKKAEDAQHAQDWPLAVELWTQYLRAQPRDADALTNLGQALRQTGRLDLAIDAYREATRISPDESALWTSLCWSLMLANRIAEAQPSCQTAAGLDPSSLEASVNLGHVHLLSGDAATARRHYGRTLRLTGSEGEFRNGPLEDFNLFISKGWQVEASREAIAWFDREIAAAGPLGMARRVLEETEKLKGREHMATAFRLNSLARLHHAAGEYDKAMPFYARALAISEKSEGPEHLVTGVYLNNLAELYKAMGLYDKALPLLVRALAISEKSDGPEHPDTAVSLTNLAGLRKAMGQYDKALPLYLRALSIGEKAEGPDHPRTGTHLNNLAGLHEIMGRYDKALPLYLRALTINEKNQGPDHTVTGVSLNNLAGLYKTLGEYTKALPLYLRALTISEKTQGPEHPDTGNRLSNLAGLHEALGEYDKALSMSERALAISEKTQGPEHPATGVSLNNVAGLHESMGRYDKALPQYLRALAISEKAEGPEHPATGSRLNNLAELHKTMGQYDKALPLYLRALTISEKALGADHPGTGISLNNLAGLYKTMGQYDKALPLMTRSLSLTEKALGPGHPATGLSLNNLAGLHLAMNQYDKALPLMSRALLVSERTQGPDHPSTGVRLNNLGGLHESLNQDDKALPLFLRAYAVASRATNPELLRSVQGNLAQMFYKQGHRELAVFYGKEAVNTIQSLRANSRGFDRASQQSFIKSRQGIYESLAQWLIEAGRLPEAQQVLAMLKEEELHGFSVRGSEDQLKARVAYLAREIGWQRRAALASSELGRLATELEYALKVPAVERTPEQARSIDDLRRGMAAAQAQFEKALAEIQREAMQAGQQASDEARASAARARNGLEILLAQLTVDGATRPAALQYLITEQKLYILVTLPQRLFSREIDIAAKDLRGRIGQFRRALRDPSVDPRPQAQALYKLLIAPVAADLEQAGAGHLMVSLSDALRYVPFAALHDGSKYLMQKYQVSMMTEAALGTGMKKPQAAWTVSALGVAAKVSSEFSALPAVAGELGAIVRSADNPGGAFPGQVYLDARFTADAYRQVIEEGQPVIHLATHFKFSPGVESQNYLLLGDGQSLSLTDMMSRRYRFRNLDLLTLSACETGLGSVATDNGREVESLGARAQLQGAPAVIATLWQVADESTGQLMKTFYGIRASNPGLNKAEAMRMAQTALLEGKVAQPASAQTSRAARVRVPQAGDEGLRFQADPATPYAHPFYWAPFVLMGNWL